MQYFVDDPASPHVLARVNERPPVVTERVVPSNPVWTRFPALISAIWDSAWVEVTKTAAAKIAKGWGAKV